MYHLFNFTSIQALSKIVLTHTLPYAESTSATIHTILGKRLVPNKNAWERNSNLVPAAAAPL